MFVLKPAARRASCVWSKLSLRAALRENNGRSSMFLAFSSGGGEDDNGRRQIKRIPFHCSWL